MAWFRDSRSSYEKAPLSDLDLSSDDGTLTPSHHQTTKQSKISHVRNVLGATCLLVFFVSWASSIILAFRATGELSRAGHILFPNSRPSYVSGAHLDAPHFGLLYNSSYCNGLKDPSGARERGCVLDPVAGGWIHKECSDPDLLTEFLKLPDFGWYLDENRTQPISQADVFAGRTGGRKILYTVDDYHFRHCEFSLRSLIRNSVRRDVGLGFLLLDHEHMNHCMERVTYFNSPEIRQHPDETVVLTGSAECYKAL